MSWSSGTETSAAPSGSPPLQSAGGYEGFKLDLAGDSAAAQPSGPVGGGVESQPSFMESMGNYLERFQKGQGRSLGEAWRERGFDPETAGYAYSKLSALKGDGRSGPAPITMNITNQQPENNYLRKRGRY